MEIKESIEKSILINAKTGDIGAFDYIVSFYEKAIFNYCLRILKNQQDAKDITQDTFIKVYTHRKSIDPEKNIKTWIFTIATNTAYDFLRSKKRKNETSLDFLETVNGETITVPGTYYMKGDITSDVYGALDSINLEYRQALLLFYQQGFSYKEIAEILSLPINTVKTHIKRGKEQLQEKLKDYAS